MPHIAILTEFFIFICFVLTGTGFGISQSSRLSSSVSAMRVLNTGSDVEEAVADALVRISRLSCVGYRLLKWFCSRRKSELLRHVRFSMADKR